MNLVGSGGRGALELCVSENRLAMLSALLLAGANPNHQDADGQSALMVAAKEGNTRAVSVLLEFGAGPNIVDQSGRTALRWLSSSGDYVVTARRLVEAGAEIDVHDEINSMTPLQCAMSLGFTRLSKYLRSHSSVAANQPQSRSE
jgi:ankyrin repeat protein